MKRALSSKTAPAKTTPSKKASPRASRKAAASPDADVIVVGGGLAGLTLAALLGAQGVDVVCIDRDAAPTTTRAGFDLRTTAISYGSHLVMKKAGVWDLLGDHPCPIKDIRILDGGSPVLLNFLSDDLDGQPFGWIVNNLDLRLALHRRISALENVRHMAPALVQDFIVEEKVAGVILSDGRELRAPVVIGADGKHSAVRKFLNAPLHGWMYDQTAIVCVVGHQHPHNNMAIEHFRAEGPFAVLPMSDDENGVHRSSLVWSVEGHSGSATANPLTYDDETFNAALAARFPADYGKVWVIGQRAGWPLGLQHVHSYTGHRMALVAEAAHAMHPIAGQGLNMGLRDIVEMAGLIVAARDAGEDMGSASLLASYQQRRHFDNMAMMAATDALTKLFSNKMPFLSSLRKLGVSLVQACPPARRFFMKQAMGTAGLVPDLMKSARATRRG